MHSNQKILTNFINAIRIVVSEGTSGTYAALIIRKFNKSNSKEFPFVEYIHLRFNKIKIDKEVNSIDPKLIRKFIKKIIGTLFSDLLTMLKMKEINKKLKTVKNPKKMVELENKKRKLMKAVKETTKHKRSMKKRFGEHVKKSGYVPPKFKGA